MEGKVYIVTGSSAGIGEATAVLLASRGARITVHGRRPDRVEATAKKCQEVSPQRYEACTVVGNIEDAEVRKQLVQGTLDKFGRIDGLVNNAGYGTTGGWEDEDLERVQRMLDVHVLSPYDLSRQVLPQLIENKGSIVMVSSIAGIRAFAGSVGYVTAKHAMDGMVKALAIETAKLGVRVNSVNPGFTMTELFRYDDAKAKFEQLQLDQLHPNGRLAQTNEVAIGIAFLLSPEASMITGIQMPIDGGQTSWIRL